MFQFRRFPSQAYFIGLAMHGLDSMRIAPFGYLRINSCLPIPAAFRSLPRPSSAPDAKASFSLTYLFRIMVSSLGHIFRCFPTEEFLRNCIYPFNLSLKLDIYFCFKIVSSLLFRYSIFKEPFFIATTFEVLTM